MLECQRLNGIPIFVPEVVEVVLVDNLSHGSKHDTVGNKVVGHVPKLLAHELPTHVVAGGLNLDRTLVLNMQRHFLQAAWMECGETFVAFSTLQPFAQHKEVTSGAEDRSQVLPIL